jgi:hypothetical protein
MHYSKYISQRDEHSMKTWTEKYDDFMAHYGKAWRAAHVEGLRPIFERLDAFVLEMKVPFNGLLGLKQLFTWYNIHTDFNEFSDLSEIRSMHAGFGGSGGQTRKYHQKDDGTVCFLNQYVGGGDVKEWDTCEPAWFASHFCTPDQWKLIVEFGGYGH